jgi:hypothetical protein
MTRLIHQQVALDGAPAVLGTRKKTMHARLVPQQAMMQLGTLSFFPFSVSVTMICACDERTVAAGFLYRNGEKSFGTVVKRSRETPGIVNNASNVDVCFRFERKTMISSSQPPPEQASLSIHSCGTFIRKSVSPRSVLNIQHQFARHREKTGMTFV